MHPRLRLGGRRYRVDAVEPIDMVRRRHTSRADTTLVYSLSPRRTSCIPFYHTTPAFLPPFLPITGFPAIDGALPQMCTMSRYSTARNVSDSDGWRARVAQVLTLAIVVSESQRASS